MTLAVAAVIYIAGLYIDNCTVVVVFAAAGENVISLCVAIVGVEADLASGINRRVRENTPLIFHFIRTVQKTSYSNLTNAIKGSRLCDAFFILASSDHKITLLLVPAALLSLEIV